MSTLTRDARPLLFLFTRTLINGVKRAVSSPKRLIGIIFFLGYYWFFFIGRFSMMGERSSRRRSSGLVESAVRDVQAMPTQQSIATVVFLIFATVTLFLSLGLFNYRGSFKAADIDVLFPLPVSPKTVLFFRFLRDYAVTLIFPLFLFFIGGGVQFARMGGGAQAIGSRYGSLFKTGFLAWILLSIAWTALGYALSLHSGRSDGKSERWTKIIGWGIAAAYMIPMLVIALSIRANPSWQGVQDGVANPIVRVLLFLPTTATAIVMGAYSGQSAMVTLGIAFLIVVVVASFLFALSGANWMYDAAASRGGDDKSTIRELQRKGDMAGIYAMQARRGKFRRARIASRFAKRTWVGGYALVWRELVTLLRLSFGAQLIISAIWGFFPLIFLFIPSTRQPQLPGMLFLGFAGGMLALMTMGVGTSNFVETLRKVDITKPLPFTPEKIVLFEVLSKSVTLLVIGELPYLVALIARPMFWSFHLTGILLAPAMILTLMSVMFLVAVMFPDFEDPTQRGFRGMVTLFATACTILPFILFVAGAIFTGYSPLLGVPFALLVAAGLSALALTWAGRLYSDYNPTE